MSFEPARGQRGQGGGGSQRGQLRPTIAVSGVSTEALVNRIDAGESMEDLAGDYGLKVAQTEHAIVYERAA